MILFINACVRKNSRTKKLADYLISKLGDEVIEVRLENIDFPITSEVFLQKRDGYIAERKIDAEMFSLARVFASADTIVIAAPFWDLSFPASLKQYIEQINVIGTTFDYTEEGMPYGLCKANNLYYVTTAGGKIFDESFGYGYIKSLASTFYGIKNTHLIKAEGLDVYGNDEEQIINQTKAIIDRL